MICKNYIKCFTVTLGLLLLSSCSEKESADEYSKGYLGAVYELMPNMLQEVMDRDDFTSLCLGFGIVPKSDSITRDDSFDTLDDFLDNQNKVLYGDTLKIASFNIQVFGRSKVAKEDVMLNLIRILNHFDLIAIQEIRDKTGEAIEILHDRMGRDTWGLSVSPALGRTISKEQYAFLYRKDKIDLEYCELWPDPKDLLHREPYLCAFESNMFEFTLINIHTDPDIVETEINVLDDIYNQYSPKYEHLLLLGDLNASPTDFDDLTRIPDIAWSIPNSINTNTRDSKNYDNILFNKVKLDEYANAYVFVMKERLGISERDALRVSDHNPVVIELIVPSEKIPA